MPAIEASSSTEPESDGVLLYYKYVKISDVALIVNWYEDICLQLGLIGRIRVSPEGVNVTVRWPLSPLSTLGLPSRSIAVNLLGIAASFICLPDLL
jgi:hypothetical protein